MRILQALSSVAACALAAFAGADSIVLKANVRLAPDATAVRLRDVAHLDGPLAESLGDVELAPAPDSPLTLNVDEVRAKLTSAGARWAGIDLSGRSVTVRGTGDRPVAMRGLALDAAPEVAAEPAAPAECAFLAADVVREQSARGMLASMLLDAHAACGADLRLRVEGADAAVLGEDDPGVRYELVPLASLVADRVDFRIIAWRGDRVASKRQITVRPELDAHVAEATARIGRGDPIAACDVIEIQRWLSPSQFAEALPASAIRGSIAAEEIEAGERLTQSKLRKAIEVRRNERVTVRREVGLIAIEMTAIALEDGGVGDSIEFQSVDRRNRRDRRTFTAIVTGPHRAVVREGT